MLIMDTKREIRILLAMECLTIEKLAEKISIKNNKKVSRANLSQKINRKTIRFIDFEEMINALGYELVIKKKD